MLLLQHYPICIIFLFLFHKSNSQLAACQFNAQCSCDPVSSATYCFNQNSFPSFNVIYKDNISMLFINGSFNSIPDSAIKNLFYIDRIEIINSYYYSISISPTAWVGFNSYKSFRFSNFKCTTIGSFAVQSMPGVESLSIDNSGPIPVVYENSFVNVTTIVTLSLTNNGVTTIQANAFNGLQNSLQELDLSDNPLVSVPVDVFTKFSTLTRLDLTNTMLTAVPTEALKPVQKTIQSLWLSNNNIELMTSQALNGFSALTDLVLDENPIIDIEPGVFYGVDAMKTLTLNNLKNLSFIDMLITYGMQHLVGVNFFGCSNLKRIALSDVNKLPVALRTVGVGGCEALQTVDVAFETWLVSNLGNNLRFVDSKLPCTADIQWMSKFVLCFPEQITFLNTYCENVKQSVAEYLKNYPPTC